MCAECGSFQAVLLLHYTCVFARVYWLQVQADEQLSPVQCFSPSPYFNTDFKRQILVNIDTVLDTGK